jgi:serine/threonine-protein kinase
MSILLQQIQKVPPPPTSINPELPQSLGAIISRCLEKDPARRYAQAADLLDALSDVSSSLEPRAA